MEESPYLGPIYLEPHWLASANPDAVVDFLADRGSRRRWHLFACACCWRILPLLLDERSRTAVGVAERLADGLASPEEVARAREDAETGSLQVATAGVGRYSHAALAATLALTRPRRSYLYTARATPDTERAERTAQCDLLRDLFGNPFRPYVFDPAWRPPEVAAIARHVYEADAFEELPILGDALEDHGCTHQPMLDHCRGGGPHARGCWVVDAVLGKD